MRPVFAALALLLTLSAIAEARGRSGSYRVGGTNSHGRWSHYAGGHRR